jgi:DNA-binding HxlR family transcriptional regulator
MDHAEDMGCGLGRDAQGTGRPGNVMAADCPTRVVLQHVTSRWGGLVMIALHASTYRFSALRRRIGGISERMLALTLQQLENDGLVLRVAHDVVPPHVEYSLTPLGQEVAAHVAALACLIEGSLPRIMAHRAGRAA